jgi:ABC-type glutathione transport system ATPase component
MVIDDHIAGRASQQLGKAKDPDAPVLLQVRSLAKSFWLKQGVFGKREFKAVQDVNFKLRKGHTLGVVGESGSGKTTMGLALLRLHEPSGGEVLFDGRDLLKMDSGERQAMRRRIQIVFQNPYASLNRASRSARRWSSRWPFTASAPTPPSAKRARVRCSTRSGSRAAPSPSIRTSSPAASGSGWRSPAA